MIRKNCSECGAARAPDQRYCLECGARLGALPPAIAAQVERVRKFTTGRIPVVKAAVAEKTAPAKRGWPFERSDFMPSPRAAAAAVIAMLALGVALGSATNQFAHSAGLTSILLEESPEEPAEEEEPAPEPVVAEPEAEASEAPAAVAVPAPEPAEAPVVEEPLPTEPEPEVPPIEEELPTGLPEVKHVFLIMLGELGYGETYGDTSQSAYFKAELPAQGELLPNYFAVTTGGLANRIALISGQGPTPATQANCPTYGDIAPGTESAEGQLEGDGCAYPTATKTLPAQLAEAKLPWKAYVEEEEGAVGAEQPSGCAATPRNPFLYFHAIADDPTCAETVVGLPQLLKDLEGKAERFPKLAYVIPNSCHEGGEGSCEEGAPTGPAASEEFLKALLPTIEESFAFKDGGLIVITAAQAPQSGEAPDTSACCLTPAYPNLPAVEEEPATGPVKATGGGGQVGALLISPFVEAGTTSETYFNHFSLLATIEDLFGLEKIGYAAEPAITGFDETIFNAAG
ncbi:MAG TPA: alkaline phosphatase family protein [Solirubrobacterales bacterium]|nr:alkaline phosphatase family protein [Solirubrobacterales bacterium]